MYAFSCIALNLIYYFSYLIPSMPLMVLVFVYIYIYIYI